MGGAVAGGATTDVASGMNEMLVGSGMTATTLGVLKLAALVLTAFACEKQ
jgi:hypothetical protein